MPWRTGALGEGSGWRHIGVVDSDTMDDMDQVMDHTTRARPEPHGHDNFMFFFEEATIRRWERGRCASRYLACAAWKNAQGT